ncbi:MAG: shikimate dehydrogenase family protein [Maricaulaceae bacterium]
MEITGQTKIIGLLADPIAQVRTPAALNPQLAEAGHNMVVVPLHVPAENLSSAWAGLKRIKSLAGLLATVPHKPAIPALCEHVEPSARQVGAANTVRREADGSMRCATFDGQGFVGGLLKRGYDPAGKRAIVAGAGGAGSAVAFALAEAGAEEVAIHNRTPAKAEALAARIAEHFPSVKTRAAGPNPAGFELVVNGTSLGMAADDAPPFEFDGLSADMMVAEVVMKPDITPLLTAAEAKGAQIQLGVEMLKEQLARILAFLTADPA